MASAHLPPRIKRSKRTQEHRSCPAHRAWVRRHHCCVPGCTGGPIECAHVRRGTDGGQSLKPSDRWTVSLCREHHAEQHRIGEAAFETRYGVDLKKIAEVFARRSTHRARLNHDRPSLPAHAPIAVKAVPVRPPPHPQPAPVERFHDLEVYSELQMLARDLEAQSVRCWTHAASRAFLAAATSARLVASALYKANLAEEEDASEGA